jgi:hypothetical protein
MSDLTDAFALASFRRKCADLKDNLRAVESLKGSDLDICLALVDELEKRVERNVLGEPVPSADHYKLAPRQKSQFADR